MNGKRPLGVLQVIDTVRTGPANIASCADAVVLANWPGSKVSQIAEPTKTAIESVDVLQRLRSLGPGSSFIRKFHLVSGRLSGQRKLSKC